MIEQRALDLRRAFVALSVDLSAATVAPDRADRFAVLARQARGLAEELEKLAVTVAELDADEPRERTGEI